MALQFSDIRLFHKSGEQEGSTSDLTLFLILTGTLFASALVIHIAGNVHATFTASLRSNSERPPPGTLRQLRGFPLFVLHRMIKVFIISRFSIEGHELLSFFILNVAVEILLSTLKVAMLHTILDPHLKSPLYPRIFSASIWRKSFPSAMLYSIASSICFYLPVHIHRELDLSEALGPYGWKYLATGLTTMAFIYFGAVVPAYAVFIRVASSTLPSQREGQGQVSIGMSIGSAWQSFPWSARISFFRLLALVFAIEFWFSVTLYLLVLILFDTALHGNVAEYIMKYLG